jgi:hypothetical protein
MKPTKPVAKKVLRCAIYTRVSTEHGLDQDFNSLDNQREAAEAYVKSQAHEGWKCLANPHRRQDRLIQIAWKPPSSQRRREIILPPGVDAKVRPMKLRTDRGFFALSPPEVSDAGWIGRSKCRTSTCSTNASEIYDPASAGMQHNLVATSPPSCTKNEVSSSAVYSPHIMKAAPADKSFSFEATDSTASADHRAASDVDIHTDLRACAVRHADGSEGRQAKHRHHSQKSGSNHISLPYAGCVAVAG